MVIRVKNIIQRRIQKSWISAKRTDDICTTKADYKKPIRYKGISRAPNLYSYRDKNKDRNRIINSRCKHRTNQLRKSPNFDQVRFWLLKRRSSPGSTELKFHTKLIHNTDPCYPANDQKNILLSNATPIGVYKTQSADSTQAVLDCRFSTD